MNKALMQVIAMVLASESSSGMFHTHPRGRKDVVYKNCMNPSCGKERTHNNTCCSAECFKALKEGKK